MPVLPFTTFCRSATGCRQAGASRLPEIAALPRLRREDLAAVLHYHDCQADDARLVLAVLLDARARGADILNRRAVTAIEPLANGYAIELDERGAKRRVDARFIVNAAGPFVAGVDAMSSIAPPPRPLRLIRGSHIVLRMPEPVEADAYTLQDKEDRVIFVLPWLDRRFLIVGTTEAPEQGDPGAAACSAEEQAYLLDAYNRYFAPGSGPATAADVVWSFAGVRALQDHGDRKPSRLTRRPALAGIANGSGGFVTLYGGKLTTHRAFAEEVLDELRDLGAYMGGPWTKDVPLYGGGEISRQRFSPSSPKARQPSPARPATAGLSPTETRSRGFMRSCCSNRTSPKRSPPASRAPS